MITTARHTHISTQLTSDRTSFSVQTKHECLPGARAYCQSCNNRYTSCCYIR